MTVRETRLDDPQARYFDALAHVRRRHAIEVLADATAPMALADLAVEIAVRESSETDGDVEQGKRVQTDLYHCHVPKLEAAGLVAFDRERRTVRLLERRSRELVEITVE